jgi:hypothetical protein
MKYTIHVVAKDGEVRAKTFARTQTEATQKAYKLAGAYQAPVSVWRDKRHIFTVGEPLTGWKSPAKKAKVKAK